MYKDYRAAEMSRKNTNEHRSSFAGTGTYTGRGGANPPQMSGYSVNDESKKTQASRQYEATPPSRSFYDRVHDNYTKFLQISPLTTADHLFQDKVITRDEYEDIRGIVGETQQTRRVLDFVLKRPQEAEKSFRRALQASEFTFLLPLLDEVSQSPPNQQERIAELERALKAETAKTENLSKEIVQLKAEKAQVQKENELQKIKCDSYKEDAEQFRSRYQSLISDRMSAPSIDPENMNDDLRPSAVADKWRYLKDMLYFQTYFDLHEVLNDKPRAWELLLRICNNAYKICRAEQEDLDKRMKDRLFDPIAQKNSGIVDVIRKGVESCFREELGKRERQKLAESLAERYGRAGQAFLEDTQKQAVGEIKRFRKLAEKKQDSPQVINSLFPREERDHRLREICTEFAQECLVLCRAMMLQEPAMHLDFDHEPGASFRVNEFAVYEGDQGADNLGVDKLLLPALFRHRAGPLLEKGLAKAKKKALERSYTADPRASRRRRDQQQESYSRGNLPPLSEGQGTCEVESMEEEVSETSSRSSGQGRSALPSSAVDALFGGDAAETNARWIYGNGTRTSTFNFPVHDPTAVGQAAYPRPQSVQPRLGPGNVRRDWPYTGV